MRPIRPASLLLSALALAGCGYFERPEEMFVEFEGTVAEAVHGERDGHRTDAVVTKKDGTSYHVATNTPQWSYLRQGDIVQVEGKLQGECDERRQFSSRPEWDVVRASITLETAIEAERRSEIERARSSSFGPFDWNGECWRYDVGRGETLVGVVRRFNEQDLREGGLREEAAVEDVLRVDPGYLQREGQLGRNQLIFAGETLCVYSPRRGG